MKLMLKIMLELVLGLIASFFCFLFALLIYIMVMIVRHIPFNILSSTLLMSLVFVIACWLMGLIILRTIQSRSQKRNEYQPTRMREGGNRG